MLAATFAPRAAPAEPPKPPARPASTVDLVAALLAATECPIAWFSLSAAPIGFPVARSIKASVACSEAATAFPWALAESTWAAAAGSAAPAPARPAPAPRPAGAECSGVVSKPEVVC